MLAPDQAEYLRLAAEGPNPVPVYDESLADLETPLGAYWKLAHDESYSFLLESVTGGEQVARYSFIGVRPRSLLRAKNGQVSVTDQGQTAHKTLNPGDDPLAELRPLLHLPPAKLTANLPKLCGGAVGLVSYDYVRTIESLPDGNPDDLDIDDVALMVCDAVVVFDHAKNLVRIIVIADGTPEGYERATAEIQRIKTRLAGPLPTLPDFQGEPHPVKANVSDEQFKNTVRRVVQYVTEGDCFQTVPSLRFQTPVEAHPLTVYRALRSLNPSPYMYLLRFDGLDVVGASPERLVGLEDGLAQVRPIAGTRHRGHDEAEDERLAQELLADPKEKAEHIMLVDLGRNDLGRVCDYGTVTVDRMMVVERYSHVMHIVSDVSGKLRSDMDAIDLLRAAFPAGTLSGAPKVRAMQIIDELETTRRGLYGGAVGYFSANGDMDLAIAIRTIVLKDGIAYVQSGAGIVYDSDPQKELEEVQNKAKAALRALEMAQRGL